MSGVLHHASCHSTVVLTVGHCCHAVVKRKLMTRIPAPCQQLHACSVQVCLRIRTWPCQAGIMLGIHLQIQFLSSCLALRLLLLRTLIAASYSACAAMTKGSPSTRSDCSKHSVSSSTDLQSPEKPLLVETGSEDPVIARLADQRRCEMESSQSAHSQLTDSCTGSQNQNPSSASSGNVPSDVPGTQKKSLKPKAKNQKSKKVLKNPTKKPRNRGTQDSKDLTTLRRCVKKQGNQDETAAGTKPLTCYFKTK